jgi:hypothetical protein
MASPDLKVKENFTHDADWIDRIGNYGRADGAKSSEGWF